MLRILTGFFSLLLLSCLTSPALAAGKLCPQRETILAFSDIVLADWATFAPTAPYKYGAEAAYLKIRYTPLPDEQILVLLANLLQQNKYASADDLAGAWYLHHFGYKAIQASAGAKFDQTFSGIGISGIRALLLQEGGEDVMMKHFAATPFMPTDDSGQAFTVAGGIVAAAIADQSDEFKERVVHAAEAHGLNDIANSVSASEIDTSAWDRFMARGSAQDNPDKLVYYANYTRAMVGHPWVKPAKSLQEERFQRIMAGAGFEPEESFLMHARAIDGGDDIAALIAGRLVEPILLHGVIRRSGTMDAAWLFEYRAAVALAGRSAVETAFDARPYDGNRYVRTSAVFTIRDVIDRLLAVEALQPYLTGKVDAMPPKPEDLSNKIDWPRWTEMATKVRDGAVSPTLAADLETFGIVTELLLAKGDQEVLRAFVQQAPSGETRLSVANDFAMRLDRACAAYLYHPGEAFTLNGRPIFKFDTE
ncbi:hypothetical protein NE852_13815 [Rhizobium sp. Pop5]|uniref:hypothetical protein n=3 Tax=Rhizobium sp. Pop5 TaxID=1223565 RepID=UPI002158711B|nr:hypothetical protein [Rhizobium sp. Pop5]UVD55181.1 hypothetical protein NE852_13815 [Rhizobium sp. Pop5]